MLWYRTKHSRTTRSRTGGRPRAQIRRIVEKSFLGNAIAAPALQGDFFDVPDIAAGLGGFEMPLHGDEIAIDEECRVGVRIHPLDTLHRVGFMRHQDIAAAARRL